MNVLAYFGHPAQYHFLKHTLRNLKEQGCNIKVLIKTKDILEDLLKEDGLEYENIQPIMRKQGKLSILTASFRRTAKVYSVARRFKADLLIGTDSSVAQAAWLLRKPSFTTLEDDVDIIMNLAKLTYPFTTRIVVPSVCRVGKWERKKLPYFGYMKLAYLHPNWFSPKREIVESYNLGDKYILLRMVKLVAHHDTGIKGLTEADVLKIVKMAEENGYSVYISSEQKLPESLESHRIKIIHTHIHHIMAYASLIISDSQSMSVEAAMLGVPSVRFSSFVGKISVLEELEHLYGLTTGVGADKPEVLMEKVGEMLANTSLKEEYAARRERMLADKIDVTAFMTWLIKEYPNSVKELDKNVEYQNIFK